MFKKKNTAKDPQTLHRKDRGRGISPKTEGELM
jgi:hypothetical protein